MHGHPAQLVMGQFDLAGVDPGSDGQADAVGGERNRSGRSHCRHRAFESGKQAVASGVDHWPA